MFYNCFFAKFFTTKFVNILNYTAEKFYQAVKNILNAGRENKMLVSTIHKP